MIRLTFIFVLSLFTIKGFAAEKDGVVKSDEAILLAGPGPGMPETMRLKRGLRLRIHHEDGAYYAVQSPAGSISWVRAAYLQFVPERTGGPVNFPVAAVIDANNQAKLRPGRLNEWKPLAYERTTVPDGTAVTVIGQKVELDNVKWFPISSPEDDVRYVLKESLAIGPVVDSKFVVTSPNSMGSSSLASPLATVTSASNSTLWRDAQAAEQSQDWDRAERLYLECAKEMARPGGSDQIAEACYAKVHELRERRRKVISSRPSSAVTPDRIDSSDRSVNAAAVTTVSPSSNRATEQPKAVWQGPGVVYASSIRQNNQKLFALQSTSQNVITYLIPGPGIDMSQSLNKSVRVYGVSNPLTGYPGKNVMTVTRIESE